MDYQISKSARWSILTILILGIGIGLSKGSIHFSFSSAGPAMRSLEEHAKHGEQRNSRPSEALQKRWIAGAKEVIAEIEKNRGELKKNSMSAKEASRLFHLGGAKAVKAKGKQYVYFPNLDTYYNTNKFCIVAEMYKKGGKDIAEEVLIELPIKGYDELNVWLPSYFAEQLMAAAKEAGVTPKIAWGVRDVNLQAIMWSRTLIRCQDDPKKYIGVFGTAAGCEKAIRREVSRPKKPGFTHMWGADIDNWRVPAFKKALAKRGFVVGCSSKLTDDKRHTTWTVPQSGAMTKAFCEVGLWF